MTDPVRAHLSALAVQLVNRRADVLRAWRAAVDADPELTTSSALTRHQLEDHLPELLAAYEAVLMAGPDSPATQAKAAQDESSGKHGVVRWQQGYQLRELVREWGHFQVCVLDEIERYAAANPGPAEAAATARRELAGLCRDGLAKSASEYFAQHRAEAAGRARDLGVALAQAKAVEAARAELLRETAHDLRGVIGVAATAAGTLALDGAPEAARAKAVGYLDCGLATVTAMLNDLMSLARLEAGHERLTVRPFDAAEVLAELCAATQAFADSRRLYLRADGPAALPVEGDPMKVQRVAQNLVLNALKYTRAGGVEVGWAADADRWVLTVRDTGPGFPAGAAPLAGALAAATEVSKETDPSADAAPAEAPATVRTGQPGEGIGLSIVKRLTELLNAAVELETTPGEGSTFRVIFPSAYPAGIDRTSGLA